MTTSTFSPTESELLELGFKPNNEGKYVLLVWDRKSILIDWPLLRLFEEGFSSTDKSIIYLNISSTEDITSIIRMFS